MSSGDPLVALRSIADHVEGAAIRGDEEWSEVELPDGCRISAQGGGLLVWRTAAIDLYCTVGAPDWLATAPVGSVGGVETFAPMEEAERVRRLWTDPRVSQLVSRLVRPGGRLLITNSDLTLITSATELDTQLDQCAALSELATHLESALPRAPKPPSVPADMAELRGLAERWAYGDDGERASLMEAADDRELRELVEVVRRRHRDIERSLAKEDSDLIWLLEAAVDARSELADRERS